MSYLKLSEYFLNVSETPFSNLHIFFVGFAFENWLRSICKILVKRKQTRNIRNVRQFPTFNFHLADVLLPTRHYLEQPKKTCHTDILLYHKNIGKVYSCRRGKILVMKNGHTSKVWASIRKSFEAIVGWPWLAARLPPRISHSHLLNRTGEESKMGKAYRMRWRQIT